MSDIKIGDAVKLTKTSIGSGSIGIVTDIKFIPRPYPHNRYIFRLIYSTGYLIINTEYHAETKYLTKYTSFKQQLKELL